MREPKPALAPYETNGDGCQHQWERVRSNRKRVDIDVSITDFPQYERHDLVNHLLRH